MLNLKTDMTIAKYSFLFFLVFSHCPFFAQNAYYFEPITVNNGLPHQTVYRVLQDKKGFMWFGTQRGLMRYDGYSSKLFGQTQKGATSFFGKSIHALLEDKKGNLWVGTHAGDFCKRDTKTGIFQYLTNENTFKMLIGKRIQSFFEDQEGHIWIGTLDDGLFVLDLKTNGIKHYTHDNSQLSNNAVFAFAQEKSGRIWVATAGEGMNYLDPKTQVFKQRYADVPNFNGYRKTLLLDNKDNLWIGSDGTGLYQIKLKVDTIKHFGAQNDGKSLSSNAVMGLVSNKNK
jgi:ligand-binding sensor domain-containing protein